MTLYGVETLYKRSYRNSERFCLFGRCCREHPLLLARLFTVRKSKDLFLRAFPPVTTVES